MMNPVPILLQQRPVVTQRLSLKRESSPGWLAARLPHYILLHTAGQVVVRGGITWLSGLIQFLVFYCLNYNILKTLACLSLNLPSHRRFRGIKCRVLKICDFKKVILSLFFKHNIAGLGVLIPKRYHMLG